MVVITAMATIMVKRFWLSAPIDRPMVATITSVEPRAFMPVPSASDSRSVSPPSAPPMNAPPNLPRLAISDQPDGQRQQGRVLEDGEVGVQARDAEEHRHEEGDDQSAQLLVDMLGEDRRFAHQDAGNEGAQHRVHADQVGDRSPSPPMISRIAVITAKSLMKLSLTQRMMENTSRPADGQAQPHEHAACR